MPIHPRGPHVRIASACTRALAAYDYDHAVDEPTRDVVPPFPPCRLDGIADRSMIARLRRLLRGVQFRALFREAIDVWMKSGDHAHSSVGFVRYEFSMLLLASAHLHPGYALFDRDAL